MRARGLVGRPRPAPGRRSRRASTSWTARSPSPPRRSRRTASGACLFRAGKITESQFRAAMRESRGHGPAARPRPRRPGARHARRTSRPRCGRRWSASCSRCCGGRAARCGREPMERPLPADLGRPRRHATACSSSAMRQFPDAERLERALGRAGAPAPPGAAPRPSTTSDVAVSPAERAVLALCRSLRSRSASCWRCRTRAPSSCARPTPSSSGASSRTRRRSPREPLAAGAPPPSTPTTPAVRPRRRPRRRSARPAACSRGASASGRSSSSSEALERHPRRARPAAAARHDPRPRGRVRARRWRGSSVASLEKEPAGRGAALRARVLLPPVGPGRAGRSCSSASCSPPTPATPPRGGTSASWRRGRPAEALRRAGLSADGAGAAGGRDAERLHRVEVGALAHRAARAGVELPVLDPHVAGPRGAPRGDVDVAVAPGSAVDPLAALLAGLDQGERPVGRERDVDGDGLARRPPGRSAGRARGGRRCSRRGPPSRGRRSRG